MLVYLKTVGAALPRLLGFWTETELRFPQGPPIGEKLRSVGRQSRVEVPRHVSEGFSLAAWSAVINGSMGAK